MREILFRGKRIDNGEWVYGYYSPSNIPFFGNIGHFINEGGFKAIEIDPKTVGQYTGLTDKNGKKIFEWDVLKIEHIGIVQWFDEHSSFMVWDKTNNEVGFLYEVNYEVEVIGNIYDNPELLQ